MKFNDTPGIPDDEIKKGKKWWSCNNATNETVTPPNLKNFPEKNVILPVMK